MNFKTLYRKIQQDLSSYEKASYHGGHREPRREINLFIKKVKLFSNRFKFFYANMKVSVFLRVLCGKIYSFSEANLVNPVNPVQKSNAKEHLK
jgi:hypothetical protein